jgi:hypothetical protein
MAIKEVGLASMDAVSGSPPRTTLYPPAQKLTPQRRQMIRLPIPESPSILSYQQRPQWWDHTHRSLQKLAEANQTRNPIYSISFHMGNNLIPAIVLKSLII